ncbi:MAG: hypothetical protein AAB691_00610 [Patescibacteria group bacterium]
MKNIRLSHYPFYLDLWFTWLIATAMYGALPFFGAGFVALIAGRFAPLGWLFFMAFAASFPNVAVQAIGALILFLVFICGGDLVAEKLGIQSSAKKIMYNLILLLVLTFLVDIVLFGPVVALSFLFTGALPLPASL